MITQLGHDRDTLLCERGGQPFHDTDFAPLEPVSAHSVLQQQLVGNALRTRIETIDPDTCGPDAENSFFVCDLGEVERAYHEWVRELPMVHAHYAVKCNPNREILARLMSLGANFDCASSSEIATILEMGVDADRIVYANPCKTSSYVRYAKSVGVNLTTVDNVAELHKLHKYHRDGAILLRIATDDDTAQCRLSSKFGATMRTVIDELLPTARSLGLDVAGVAFHIGSGAADFTALQTAIEETRAIFDRGLAMGFAMRIVDIGGGFQRTGFEGACKVVRALLKAQFPEHYTAKHQIRFIAEPGRFMVERAFTLATHVIARREDVELSKLYVNDGVYGNMNCIIYDHQYPQPRVLCHAGRFAYGESQGKKAEHQFSVWGPTCDGLDCVAAQCHLTHDVDVGDWLYFEHLGAYTSAATTRFNGFMADVDVIYVDLYNSC